MSRVSGTSAATRSTTSRQNSTGKAASKASLASQCSARDGTPWPPPGCGNQRRWKCFLAKVMAASKRMTRKRRAMPRMVRIIASRTSGIR